ncbi:putative DNA-directed RNA polymerase [Clavispora lusitaniae]|uniref:DNA-directed RNA polymerase n=3 Tax=Clavispora lusitaniae TaxID=36911 RepID=C4Y8E3_CLAL4|nr:uncharacterized protein CLUG_04471 [Clavispora lusitaniae ATCC 42720]KAF5209688.1 DNA-directed RNA polymerase [Clavispora lusitaniae]EEQ40343.1 hypothetical protein CLUG_04471 [Clavispora lusitaniae ATCC 42720]KAF7581717.1 DNA-dependent RNA polymerase family protein [Clavispora lusitaniae]OVF09557.1 putative DNA-directed RNA polymerase [Clavispora lusitaniae]QFZ29128.1 putative DNA-directed RNA polymerase [Clavispora lusitaniae]
MRSSRISQLQRLDLLCKRYHTTKIGARFNATSAIVSNNPSSQPNFNLKKDINIYTSLVEELRRPQKETRSSLSVANKPFNEIKPSLKVSEEDRKEVAWSSAYDPVTRSPFAKDVIHLQSLLDALLASKNFSRAGNILKAMFPLMEKPESFVPLMNKYLEAYSLEESVTIKDLEDFVDSMQRQFPIHPNDRTYALLISKSLDDELTYTKFLDKAKSSRNLIRKTLNHVDVISAEGLSKIFEYPGLNESHIPRDLLPMFHEARNQSKKPNETADDDVPEYFKEDDVAAPMIEKDATELKAVDSFGLKVIRHTLLGLESKDDIDLEKLFRDLDEDSKQHILHNTKSNKKRNYHEIYKSLKTPEEKRKFDQALDIFNENRQRELESKGIDAAREKWKHEFEDMQTRGGISLSKNLNVQLYQWYLDMLPYVQEEVSLCRQLLNNEIDMTSLSSEEKKQMKDRSFYAPYLVLIPPKKLSVITILELLKLNSTGGIVDGMRTARAVISVGKAIELEYKSQGLVAAEKRFLGRKAKSSNQWKKILRNRKPSGDEAGLSTEWDYPVYAKLGSVLTSLLLHVAKVPVTGTDPTTGKQVKGKQPAFHHTYQFVNGQRLGIIKLHKNLVKQLASNTLINSVQPQLLPMLLPPSDWTSHNQGGYRFTPSTLVRIKDSAETVAYVKAASEANNLDDVYRGLNVLGHTPWTINAKVLEVISQYWNTGEAFLDIPPVVDEPELPPPLPLNAEPLEKVEYQRKVRHVLNEAAAYRSQRCDTNYKLEIARAFVGEKMYFPHNVDFRGRAYPLPPHLNHLGNDLTRSLFLFWEGRELGERGLEWLKIHLANVYGMDKAPLAQRAQFVDDNLEHVFESARDPTGGSKWWTKGEKPWQVLSVCFELLEAYKLDDPTKYVSHVPVHQDGTCNGLQHYAALGGDIEGAKQVNLVPADRPQDVYKFVAGLVEKRLQAEAEAGNKYAIFLQGKISRKVVKQTVMTNVYGVTFVGAVAQIEKQLGHLFEKDDYDSVTLYARYLTSLVFASMRELFEGAHLIQDWLGESAKRISKSVRIDYEEKSAKNANKPSHLSSVIWTTPLGLPCVQPYRATKRQIVSTNLQDISISDPFGATQVDSRKQQTAFPPNFIHSLDATHMLMTAAACGEDNLHFASVHDSYWTHACDVDKMSEHIRNQFVKLHEENLIVKLRDEFERRYKGFLQVISIPGDHEVALRIKEVRRKIVKDLGRGLTVADEIYIEKKRQELLESPDASEVQMGKEMVTTVSVTEGYDLNKIAVSASSSKALQILAPLSFPDIPPRGSLDVQVVKQSPYFFS